eukprot:m.67206 g.67206  ORF g.67206 m.67206 type:complete len:81 (-) comp12159_c1_seq4:473-715(-)
MLAQSKKLPGSSTKTSVMIGIPPSTTHIAKNPKQQTKQPLQQRCTHITPTNNVAVFDSSALFDFYARLPVELTYFLLLPG